VEEKSNVRIDNYFDTNKPTIGYTITIIVEIHKSSIVI